MNIKAFLVNSILILSVFCHFSLNYTVVPAAEIVPGFLDKCTVSFNPIKAPITLIKAAWNNKGWATAAVLGVLYVGARYDSWRKGQILIKERIDRYLEKDSLFLGTAHKDFVKKYARQVRTLFFRKDLRLIGLVNEFYTCKVNNPHAKEAWLDKLQEIRQHLNSTII